MNISTDKHMTDHEVKRALIAACAAALREKMAFQKRAMDTAQAEANTHKGAMSSRYDTFKEEAQALRDGHAKQVQQLGDIIALVQQLDARPSTKVCMGAVVQADGGNFFVSTGLVDEPITIDGVDYDCIGPTAPLLQQLRGLPNGQKGKNFGKEINVIRVF